MKMKAAYDLHIHTALSACSDNEMTPNNIINMAVLKGLDIIAITDHNSIGNFEAVSKCGVKNGILVVPGMEIETREEVHLLSFFPGMAEAEKMQEIVQASLPKLKIREDIFGQQVLYDENDYVTGYFDNLLSIASEISIEEVFEAVDSLKGVVVPAHVDRESYSLISNLGVIPQNLNIEYVEVSKQCDILSLMSRYPYLAKYNILRSSDAHTLGSIMERESFIELEEISAQGLITKLRNL